MTFTKFLPKAAHARPTLSAMFMAVAFVSMLAVSDPAMAQDFKTKTCGFLGNITSLLNIASIAVVTIGIIFAGYQIAFAHKRISDVAPILIGALLIGAAGQLATWIIGSRQGSASCGDISAIQQMLPFVV